MSTEIVIARDACVSLVETIVKEWDNTGICFAIANGIEDYPQTLGRDLDVFISPKEIERALFLAGKILREGGWTFVHPKTPYSIKQIYAFKGSHCLQLDIFSRLSWWLVPLVQKIGPRVKNGPFWVDPWVHFAKAILIKLLAGELPGKFNENIVDNQVVMEKCKSIIGRKCTVLMLSSLKKNDRDSIGRLIYPVRKAVMKRGLLCEPYRLIRVFSWLRVKIIRHFTSVAPWVTLVGPDGVGKSHTLRVIAETNRFSTLWGCTIKHWRPHLLPRLGAWIRREPEPVEVEAPAARRNPGRGHWVRLFYYSLDFIGGHFLRDNLLLSRPRLVVYDRCGLDMAVDFLRYGLASVKGTKQSWKLTPNPDLVVLLHDTPERIVTRKGDLDPGEVKRQLREWLKWAEVGEVDAIIRVDAPPEEIASRANDLITWAFIKKNGGNLAAHMSPGETLSWLSSILTTGNTEEARFETTRGVGNGDYQPVMTFAAVPGFKAPRLLIPMASKLSAAASLGLYNAQRPLARMARKALSIGLSLGVTQPFLKNRLYLSIRKDFCENGSKMPLILEALKEVFDNKRICLALAAGTPGVHRKPVIQVMEEKGRILGYAKVGWNQATIRLVRNEENILRRLSKISFTTAQIPTVLHALSWNHASILVTSAPPSRTNRPPQQLHTSHLQFVNELSAIDKNVISFPESLFWQTLQARAKMLEEAFPYYSHLINWGVEKAHERFSGLSLPFSWRHGDFVPSNTKLLVDNYLFIFDWEYAQRDSPPAWDLFHFLVQTGVLIHRWKPIRILQSIFEGPAIRHFFSRLGFENEWINSFFMLYLLDVLSWELVRSGHLVDLAEQQLREAWGRLLAIILMQKDLIG
jgi:hypothetical protein